MQSLFENSHSANGVGGSFTLCILSAFIQPLTLIWIAMTMTMGGCTINRATGERHLNFTGESQEISIGHQADREVSITLGLYPDESLQRYIQQLGRNLALNTERPNLPWTFRVLDDPTVNAFALPGGFIYVTRGILAYLDNEAELAGVLGHEIGHVTAQHSVHQIAMQQLTGFGPGVGVALKPELQPYADLAGTGLGILFLKFSRDDESQADELGVRYMTRANNDPRQLSAVMTMLDRLSQDGNGRVPEWLATHPGPANRREHIDDVIRAMNAPATGRGINREAYLREIDGMIFGQNPREGFFRGRTFFQPDLKFQFVFPAGWQIVNRKQAVVGVSAEQDAVIQVGLSDKKSPNEAANAFFSQNGVTAQRVTTGRMQGFVSTSGNFKAQSEQGAIQGFAAFVGYDGHVYQLLGYTSQAQWQKYEHGLVESINSFNRLTDKEILTVKPQRLSLIKINKNMSLEAFNERYFSDVSLEVLAQINQVEPNAQLQAGQQVKRIVGKNFE